MSQNKSFSWAIDNFEGMLAREGRTSETRRKYRCILNYLADEVRDKPVDEITPDDCKRFLNRWVNSSPSTLALHVSILKVFFSFLEDEEIIERNPVAKIKRPRKKRPEDLDVVAVSEDDVRKLFDAVETWQELLCLSVLCYMGPRRRAASQLRWRDVDLEEGRARFSEKGGKVIVKPIPDELRDILKAALEHPEVPSGPDDYVIPNFMPSRVTRVERKPDIVYATVVRIADRAGVRAHAHSLRAAFAVRYLETHPGDIEALQALMGHTRTDTTQVYLRKLNRERAMERVRNLSWGSESGLFPEKALSSEFPPNAEEAHTGFEPVFRSNPVQEAIRRKLTQLQGGISFA
jgi:integrase/recombinase XerD